MRDDITEWRHRIDAAVMEPFDFGARADARRTAGSRRRASERTLREVRDVAGPARGRDLSDWIEEEIRTRKLVPSAREVRKRGAGILRVSGHEVSTGNWLGA
jgi:hypothetical protein